jgi:hypothetical protein
MLQNPLLINKSEIKSKVLNEKIVNLLDKTFRIPQEFSYNVVEITSDYIARMDLLSKQLYGDIRYQDVLCKLNGISNPFELNEGMILVIPSPENIMDFMKTPLNSECDGINDNKNKPVAKNKTEKRKPNEAIIGDARFKIDKERGVVIY